MAKLTLYGYWRSSCSWRVRIALLLKNIDYETRVVNIAPNEKGNEQHKAEFLAVNPFGHIPALVIEDGNSKEVLSQSIAIIEYLDETYPSLPRLLPADPLNKAKVRALVDSIASGIQPLQNLNVLAKVTELDGNSQQWARHFIADRFVGLEKMLKETAGKYCYGDSITLVDICLVPQVYNAHRFGVDMTEFPLIARLTSNLATIDAFAKSHPDRQPDAPRN